MFPFRKQGEYGTWIPERTASRFQRFNFGKRTAKDSVWLSSPRIVPFLEFIIILLWTDTGRDMSDPIWTEIHIIIT